MPTKKTTKKATRKRTKKAAEGRPEGVEGTLVDVRLQEEPVNLDPVVPEVPSLPEPPASPMLSVCRHCHLLPAAAYELVLVFVCLVFSLSAVLLTSLSTINAQQQIIQSLENPTPSIYASR